jgi:RNA polymerase sigma-B factor
MSGLAFAPTRWSDEWHVVEQRATVISVEGVVMLATLSSCSDRDRLDEDSRQTLRLAREAGPGERRLLQDQVVCDHLWLADALARRYRRGCEDLDDLVQVARSGLVQAVRRYDPDHGPLIAFVVPTITGLLKRHYRDHGWLVRPPRRTQELSAELRRSWPVLTQQFRGAPTDEQIATRIGATVEAVRDAAQANRSYRPESLDAMPPRNASAMEIGPADEISRCETRLLINQLWRQLSREERRLLRLRFYEERSQSDIASRLGISQMQVSRLLARTLQRMRTMIGELDQLDVA